MNFSWPFSKKKVSLNQDSRKNYIQEKKNEIFEIVNKNLKSNIPSYNTPSDNRELYKTLSKLLERMLMYSKNGDDGLNDIERVFNEDNKNFKNFLNICGVIIIKRFNNIVETFINIDNKKLVYELLDFILMVQYFLRDDIYKTIPFSSSKIMIVINNTILIIFQIVIELIDKLLNENKNIRDIKIYNDYYFKYLDPSEKDKYYKDVNKNKDYIFKDGYRIESIYIKGNDPFSDFFELYKQYYNEYEKNDRTNLDKNNGGYIFSIVPKKTQALNEDNTRNSEEHSDEEMTDEGTLDERTLDERTLDEGTTDMIGGKKSTKKRRVSSATKKRRVATIKKRRVAAAKKRRVATTKKNRKNAIMLCNKKRSPRL
jgi:hypothetical protein